MTHLLAPAVPPARLRAAAHAHIRTRAHGGATFEAFGLPAGRKRHVIERTDWLHWIDGAAPARLLPRPSPSGTFLVEQVA